MGKQYRVEIRSAVLNRYRSGEPVTSVSSASGIARSTIYTWINQSIAVPRQTEISQYDYRLLEKMASSVMVYSPLPR